MGITCDADAPSRGASAARRTRRRGRAFDPTHDLRPLGEAVAVGLDLAPHRRVGLGGVRPVDREQVHQVDEDPRALDVAQEAVPESLALVRARDQPGQVGEDEAPVVAELDEAEVRLERRERVVGDPRRGARDAREERRLARVGQADEPRVGEQAQLELQLALGSSGSPGVASRRRLVGRRREARVAEPAPPALAPPASDRPDSTRSTSTSSDLGVAHRRARAARTRCGRSPSAPLQLVRPCRAPPLRRAKRAVGLHVAERRQLRYRRRGSRRRRGLRRRRHGPPIGTNFSRWNAEHAVAARARLDRQEPFVDEHGGAVGDRSGRTAPRGRRATARMPVLRRPAGAATCRLVGGRGDGRLGRLHVDPAVLVVLDDARRPSTRACSRCPSSRSCPGGTSCPPGARGCCPATTRWPAKTFTPRNCGLLSRPLRLEP